MPKNYVLMQEKEIKHCIWVRKEGVRVYICVSVCRGRENDRLLMGEERQRE